MRLGRRDAVPDIATDSTAEKPKWDCPQCTLENEGGVSVCEVCYYVLPSTQSVTFTPETGLTTRFGDISMDFPP